MIPPRLAQIALDPAKTGVYSGGEQQKGSLAMEKYIVTLDHNGETWPLRGTVWAYAMDRAQVFASQEAAREALDRAKKFMSAKQYRAAKIVPVA